MGDDRSEETQRDATAESYIEELDELKKAAGADEVAATIDAHVATSGQET